MKVRTLIEHLSKLDPDAEILPTWESHVPGDFGGLIRGGPESAWWVPTGARPEDVILLDCEGYPGDCPTWDLPPA